MRRALLCAGWLALAPGAARPADRDDRPAPADPLDLRRQERDAAAAAADRAETGRRATQAEVEAIRTDRAKLAAALVATAGEVRAAEDGVTAAERRLDLLVGSEEATRAALQSRRAVIADVLAALQRIGRRPPPALLASPADALGAIRSSMLLGAVVPELREAADSLASDLEDLRRLKGEIAAERDRLAGEVAVLDTERLRLAALISARQAAESAALTALGEARRRAAGLALQAAGLKELVARLESEAEARRRDEEKRRLDEEARLKAAEAEAREIGDKATAAGGREPPRLTPSVPFADRRGGLALPASGSVIKGFGDSDSYGGQERGQSLATRPGAVVSAPADGRVSFAGPYRSYGQLLIVDAGDGYYIVLAGLGRVDVVPGQFVLAGEPVGAMGDGSSKTAAAISLGAAKPVLYVELRKDGAAIDPSPWWAKAGLEKVRG